MFEALVALSMTAVDDAPLDLRILVHGTHQECKCVNPKCYHETPHRHVVTSSGKIIRMSCSPYLGPPDVKGK
jgi:hypothetical protein